MGLGTGVGVGVGAGGSMIMPAWAFKDTNAKIMHAITRAYVGFTLFITFCPSLCHRFSA